MIGLSQTTAASSSLLLNLEGVLTTLLAWFVFKENFDRRIALGTFCILLGGIILSWGGSPTILSLRGPLFVSAACLCWALDNNFTKKISGHHPVQLVTIKSIVAGGTNISLALALGSKLPGLQQILATGIVGLLGYGFSLLSFILALRHIGAARTGAYFSLAPFVGSAIAVVFLGDKLTAALVVAACFMAFGVWLHLTENHGHTHEHDELEHTHTHEHDEHHQHAHGTNLSATDKHSHRHKHTRMRHTHAHFPDIHHQHSHE